MAASAAGALAALAPGASGEAARPNILFVCTDQQHWQAWGGADPFFDTPAIDRLAREGTVFTHHFCTTPQCSPSRSSIYTGLYPHATGVLGNVGAGTHTGGTIGPMRTGIETIGARLKAAGYHTGYFGKWHLGNVEHYSAHFDTAEIETDPHDGATESALRCLEARSKVDAPFALFVNYLNPHDIYHVFRDADSLTAEEAPVPPTRTDDLATKPWPQLHFMEEDQGQVIHEQPAPFWHRYRRYYREMVRLVDTQLGRLLEGLDRLGLIENTLIVFTSDHGDMDTQHNLIFKGPFMYEHMVRVPLIVRGPASLGGRHMARTDALTTGVDFVPTLCALAGAKAADTHGQSFASILTGVGVDFERDHVVGQYYGKQTWISPNRMFRTREWKYNRYIHHGEELYDLVNDPHELNNLAHDPAHAIRKAELAGELDHWMKAHGDTEFEQLIATDRQGKSLHP
jgi:arylsulfatase A-like enzyme